MSTVGMKLHTYLNYGGNCKEAFQFYEKHLGGKITTMFTYADAPGAGDAQKISPEQQKKILHARIVLGETEIMASDVPPEAGFQPMRSVYLSLNVSSTPEAERLHALLSDGGEIFMPMQETFYAYRFSMLRDKFGTSWMIIHERPMPQSS
ncbi:MAG TPA: VOC family protein [Acidobacteriaceae bacterium]|nr:VOC family protein [Acidobacteriaceae bacterium]